MDNLLLYLFLSIIVLIIFAEIYRVQNAADRPLLIGFVLGILGAWGYNKWTRSSKERTLTDNIHKIYMDLGEVCNEACRRDKQQHSFKPGRRSKKSQEQHPRSEDGIYTDYPNSFPTNFEFGQNEVHKQVIPDGRLKYAQGVLVSDRTYDMDGNIINGNIVGSADKYDDDFWLDQQKSLGDDSFTAASLHMSRKPREAFYYQSRWGQNSIRPWIQAELNDHSNKIWWEDNPDLEQYI